MGIDSCSAKQADCNPTSSTSLGMKVEPPALSLRDYAGKQADCNPTSSTILGMKVEPPALSLRDYARVDKGAAAPKPCLSPMKMRTLTAAGGLLPTGTTSTATKTIFHQPPLWFCPTEKINSRTTSIRIHTTQYSSFWKMKVLETKRRQTQVFDPGGCTGHLRACPFLRRWRVLLCREIFVWTLRWYPRLECFW